ncbi:MAG: hypothetical protein HYX84_04530 [Chloroflexi bacterium]|nr:hypothetical protein [Chloroflexota bacterium]
MDIIKLVIERYVPIIIAAIALATSIYSVTLTRQSFVVAHRPYVWAGSYGVIDPDKKTIIPVPFTVAYRVLNSPARIIRKQVKIDLMGEPLLVYDSQNEVRFPDEKSEWTFTTGKDAFERIMNRPGEEQAKLSRIISIEYSSLDGGRIYRYKLEQLFSPVENQWIDSRAEAD